MKRLVFVFIAVLGLVLAGCKPEQLKGEISVNPESLEFSATGGTRQLSVTSTLPWTLEVSAGSDWCTSSRNEGDASAKVNITVSRNEGDARSAEIVFTSAGCEPVKVKVSQEKAEEKEEEPESDLDIEHGKLAAGFTISPKNADADSPAKIYFKAGSSSGLYNHFGDVYVHIGLADEYDEWKFVPADWNKNIDKCKMTKEAANIWSITLQPSIREWFNSGEMPVNTIAIIARSADGTIKGIESDTFLRGITDTKYKAEVFTPDQVVEASMPEGVKHGINYNSDNSVTFVLYDKDTGNHRHEYCYILGDWNDWERVSEGAMKYDKAAGCWWITLDGFDADVEYRFQYSLGTVSGADIRVSDPYTEIVYDEWNDQYIDGVPAFPEKAKALVSAFQINRPEYSWKHSDFKVEDKNDLVIYEMLFRDFTTSQNIEGTMAELDYIENLGVNAVQLMPVQEFDGNLSWGYNPNHWFALDKYYGTREQYKEFIDECHSRGLAVIVDVVYNHATGSHPWAKMWWNGGATASNNPFFNVLPTHPYNVYHDMNHDNAMVKEHVKRSLEYLLTEYDVDGFRFDLTKGFTQKKTDPDVTAWGKYDQSRVDILKGYADHIWSVNEDAVVIFEHLAEDYEEQVLANHGVQLWRNVNAEYHSAVSGGRGDFSRMYSTAPFGGYVGYMESHDEERLCYGDVGTGDVKWGVIGLGNNWNNDKIMEADGPFFVAKNLAVTATDRFKIRKAGEWNNSYNYGASSSNYKLTVGEGYLMKNGSDSKDIYVPAEGTYDIYFSPDMEMVWLMNAGDRPDESQVEVAEPEEPEDPHALEMRRAGASAAFFLTVPGPKMIWQFGEIGYDYSINYNDRTGEKPVVTDEYLADPQRKALYDTYASLLKFRRENPRFFDKDAKFEWTPAEKVKTITCTVDGKTFHVVGNFGRARATVALPAGQWNDYMNGNATVSGDVTLKQGEFRLLTNF